MQTQRCPPDLRVLGSLTRRAGVHLQPIDSSQANSVRTESPIGRARHALLEGRGWTLRRPFAPDLDEATLRALQQIHTHGDLSPEYIAAVIGSTEHIVNVGLGGGFVMCDTRGSAGLGIVAATLVRLGVVDRDLLLFDAYPATGQSAATLPSLSGYPAERARVIAAQPGTSAVDSAIAEISLLLVGHGGMRAATDALAHLYPRLCSGGILLMQDRGSRFEAGQAVDAYFGGRGPFLHRVDQVTRLAVKP